MIDIIWCIMILIAIFFSLLNGTVGETLNAVGEGAKSAVNLSILMAGTMAFWVGLTRIAENSGITAKVSFLLTPILKRLFPHYASNTKAMEKISLNITANIFGLGNAATPLGLEAMQTMNEKQEYPNRDIILFVVINTASLQLIPTNIAALRSAYGSNAPFSVMPYVWISSLGALTVSILMCKLFERVSKWRK